MIWMTPWYCYKILSASNMTKQEQDNVIPNKGENYNALFRVQKQFPDMAISTWNFQLANAKKGANQRE